MSTIKRADKSQGIDVVVVSPQAWSMSDSPRKLMG
jgi:hypothetical protein